MHAFPALVLAFSLCGCAAKDANSDSNCRAQHPAGSPFDVGDVSIAAPMPMPGSTAEAPIPPAVDSIAAVCSASAGTGCDPSRFISKEAAECLATLDNFAPGLTPWSTALLYDHGYQRVVWHVRNRTLDSGNDGYAGQTLTIDASNERVLSTTGYDATP